jgi:hypothetical protein
MRLQPVAATIDGSAEDGRQQMDRPEIHQWCDAGGQGRQKDLYRSRLARCCRTKF